jgi:uncharacterized phage protein (TIGR01671 family)
LRIKEMRDIKFRQRIKGIKFKETTLPDSWHYWGYDIDGREFIGPIGKVEWDDRPSYMYTGLQDCKGKEVWEGDICKCNHPDDRGYHLGHIIFNDEMSAFMLQRDLTLYGDILLCEFDKIEVIGNIYENRSLLNENSEPLEAS